LGAVWGEEFVGSSFTTNFNYIVLPVFLKYKISNLSIGLGPQLGFLLSANDKYNGKTSSSTNGWKSTDFSALLNTDYEVNENIVIGLRYQIGLSSIVLKNDIFSKDSNNAKNNSFQFSIGYKF